MIQEMLTSSGYILMGLIALSAGGELLVRGASRLARAIGISPLVVGLTVVAFGTSSPEFAVSIKAGMDGQTDLALGNIIGSNIFNVLFILGLSALVTPLVVSSQLISMDVPLMVAASALMYVLCLDGTVGRGDGLLLVTGLVAYVVWSVVQSRKETAAIQAEYAREYPAPEENKPMSGVAVQLALIVGGLILLTIGAQTLVHGSVTIARLLGMSELLIGLTIISIGTSLPEVAASVMASLKGERDIAVGNVVGSNLFNILGVLGVAALTSGGVPVSSSALRSDLPIMLLVGAICLPIFFTARTISRWEGGLFLLYYIIYTLHLVLDARQSPWAPGFTQFVGWVLLPMTVVLLSVHGWLSWRNKNAPKASRSAS
jgi:cation:H+ antiporter